MKERGRESCHHRGEFERSIPSGMLHSQQPEIRLFRCNRRMQIVSTRLIEFSVVEEALKRHVRGFHGVSCVSCAVHL